MARVTVQEFQRVVLHQSGAAPVVLGPGRHRYRKRRSALTLVDLRPTLLKVTGQEILTADGVGVRAAVVVRYAVVDALAWVLASDATTAPAERLYLAAQLAIRDVVATRSAEDLLIARAEVGAGLAERVRDEAGDIGADVQAVDLRDLSFPGELRRSFAQVALARQEAAAALERARGETATLRSLANAARTLDGNPALRELRGLLAVERSGGTLVFKGGDAAAPR
ncbi:SPFH domain-containing protein [Actinotalea sp. M2MS4P-6]|uniref:SPFH domain-containing protein n=1 Tax=Actinotalea sp. M2MS4P-6 TaxID=2983762 RepID=UPI0021E37755|nr:SPFH domain-containing protein [Actinotalea sp. M2MS4P-6]MCV2393702.1 SPFH domain-containing protein [Actinotalea sp. M2MS4P-6]